MFERLKKLKEIVAASYIVWALIAFVSFDAILRSTYSDLGLNAYNSPNRSWVWWAVKDFHNLQQPPDVMLMGSSLMMAALHGGDATYLELPQNVAFHHRSVLLEELLTNKTDRPVSTFAFAIGGQMVSDAYALCSTLFVGDKKPKMLVYGIAPRDFMDNTLTSPASTETFRYMSRLGGLQDVGWQARATFWEKVEYAIACVSSVYAHRTDFVYLQNHYVKQLAKHICGFKDLEEVHTAFALRRQALLELPEDQGPNDLMVMPYKNDDAQAKYVDNTAEYRMRYRAFKPKLFEMQLSFLEKMLRYCSDEGIIVELVNMPLTADNVALMPPGFYDNYKNRIGSLAEKYQAEVIDLNDQNVFTKQDFADSVHMNGDGGIKFFNQLAQKLNAGSRVASKHTVLQ